MPTYIVQVFNGRTWRKVRGHEGGPWSTRDRAERIARGREKSPWRTSSTEGMPHRVVEVVPPAQGARVCACGEPEDGGEFGWFDATDGHTYCNACGKKQ